ncbi:MULTISPECIES: GNAT family N-acetyltransferase [Halorubrum]|uniref:Acetyltransferase n=1 Tax=Halorubrum hochstenium ATCC 700873 TaxID=1227481 RepID=M0FFN1_9EURY|nr:GNAT family N-acetyltransferase [Halorubrum hochsteinianum]ELZ57424.1 acetyltransferase [Halorubrum hochstenium ATCC 700873]
MRETGVDPSDIPGTDDLRSIRTVYLDSGGAFIVGVLDSVSDADSRELLETNTLETSEVDALATHDGTVVAMGGFMPNSAGHADERDRPGAAELHRMRVAPPFQRQGLGRELITELERRATAAGFESLLATTSTRQSAALSFYPDRGYEEVERSAAGEYELVHYEKSL